MESALRRARDFRGPVIVHAVTRKGNGYPPAENDEAEQMHSPAAFDPVTGLPTGPPSVGWTTVFAREMVELGARRPDVVAITAAMLGPTGLVPFAEAYPDRCFDVGIAEQHALTSAAGLAMGGLHPVVAVYATFLNRAFDQLLMDFALHGMAVTVVLDRAGVTGKDGPSHNGMWDMSIAGVVPGMRVAAPRDAATLREELAEAVRIADGPSVVRFPKGPVIESVPALRRVGRDRRAAREPGRRGRGAAGVRRGVRRARRSRRPAAGPQGIGGDRGRPALGAARCRTGWSRWPAGIGWWSPCRTAAGTAASDRRWPSGCARPSATCRCATGRAAAVPRPRQSRGRAGRSRADRTGRGPAGHRVGGRAAGTPGWSDDPERERTALNRTATTGPR